MGDTKRPGHIVHFSYAVPRPAYRDPEEWLKRVAFISGVPEQLSNYADQTVIYNIDYRGEITRNGVRYLFPAFKRRQLFFPFGFNGYIKRLKPDVVIVHGLIFPVQIIMLRMLMGPSLKIICQHHAEPPFRDLRKYLARWADKYIHGYLFASKVQAINWVSSTDKVHEIIGASSYFQPSRIKTGSTYVWVGDLNENKNPLRVARAFAQFSARHSEVLLYMIYPTNELEKDLIKIISGTSQIRLVDKVEHSQMQDWFNRADYVVSSSFSEGSGIAVCEALSCGCIPIVSNIPSFSTMTKNYAFGASFEPGDEKSLLAALEKTYNIDRAVESEKVIRFFQNELSFEANARKIMNVISE